MNNNSDNNTNINVNINVNIIHFLQSRFLNLYQVDYHSKETLLYGVPQGGKSAFTFANIAIQMNMNKPCIFVVRNYVKDAIHMIEKAKRFSDMLMKNGMDPFESVYAGDMVCKWDIDDEGVKYVKSVSNSLEIKNALFSDKKKMVIVLANVHQLSALNFILNNIMSDNLMLFIDEADAIAYGLQDIPTNIEFAKLVELSSQKFEVTATPWDNLVGNNELENQNIIVLQPPPSYKGIRNVEFHDLKYKIGKYKGNIIEEDPNLIGFYDEISLTNIFDKVYQVTIPHPVIVLHKTSTATTHHDDFFTYFRKSYKKWVVIKEDSNGLFMFSETCKGKTITIEKHVFIDDNKNGVFNFKDHIIIPQLMQWMIDNGGANVFSHIVIKSGRFSGRSRSYVSSDGNWHLTHQYYNGSTNVPSLIQEMRIVHDRPDAIPLRCYAPPDVGEAIQKGAIMLDEQIDRLKNKQRIRVKEFVENGKWNPEKIPKKVKLTIGTSNMHFKIKKTARCECDNGWAISTYRDQLATTIRVKNENENGWVRGGDYRLHRKDGETCVELLRRTIMSVEDDNTWKTAKEWRDITGLCGYVLESSYHFAIMTTLVKDEFLERNGNRTRVKK